MRQQIFDVFDAFEVETVYVSGDPKGTLTCNSFLHLSIYPHVGQVLVKLLESAVAGADAVLSGLGARSNSEAGVASQGTLAIVRAMQATDARRLVVVSAAPIGTVPSPDRPKPPKHDPGDGFFMRNLLAPMVKAGLRERYADLALMEDVVRESGLDWTIVRPAQLTDKPLSGTYRTAYGQNLRRGLRISRADVADLMLRALEQPETIYRTIGIAN